MSRAFIEVMAPMPLEPEGPTAVWEHPQRGRLVFSGLTASMIPALMQGFLGEARQ